MAITKTAYNLIGTSASKSTIAGGASEVSSSRDASTIIGIILHCLATYGGSIPDSNPIVEVLTSPDNTNFDTTAYAVEEIPREAGLTKMISIPIGPEVKYYKVKVTNGGTNSADFWISAVEMLNS